MGNKTSKMSEILEIIREARYQREFSQEFMATKLGISQSTYSKLEQGKIPMNMETFTRILKLFGVNTNKMYRNIWDDLMKKIAWENKNNKGFLLN